MAFSRPTLEELIERIIADASSRLNGTDGTVLRRSVLGIIMRQIAGASHMLHGHLDWISRQIIPDTAEGEYLERWADVWGVTRNAATFAGGNVTLTGSNGSVVPQGTVLVRSDGAEFTTSAEATIASGTATVAVVASVAGADGNTDAAATLTFQSPVAGVSSAATVTAGGLASGTDTESDEDLLARLLARIQDPPNGGSASDYEQWALEVSGVTRAWVYPSYLGAGTVGVCFVRDDDASIFPDVGEVATVQAYIDDLRPVTADVTVFAPVAYPLDMTIQIDPNTTAVQQAIQAELEDLILREAEPGGTLLLSHINEAISIAAGETDHVLVTPAADVTAPAGELVTLGTITWQAIP